MDHFFMSTNNFHLLNYFLKLRLKWCLNGAFLKQWNRKKNI